MEGHQEEGVAEVLNQERFQDQLVQSLHRAEFVVRGSEMDYVTGCDYLAEVVGRDELPEAESLRSGKWHFVFGLLKRRRRLGCSVLLLWSHRVGNVDQARLLYSVVVVV